MFCVQSDACLHSHSQSQEQPTLPPSWHGLCWLRAVSMTINEARLWFSSITNDMIQTDRQTDVYIYAHKQNIKHYKYINPNKGLKMFMISTCSILVWTDVKDPDCNPTSSVPISVIKCNNCWEIKLTVIGKQPVPDFQNSLKSCVKFSVLKAVFSADAFLLPSTLFCFFFKLFVDN